jgi:hypothetical protein
MALAKAMAFKPDSVVPKEWDAVTKYSKGTGGKIGETY